MNTYKHVNIECEPSSRPVVEAFIDMLSTFDSRWLYSVAATEDHIVATWNFKTPDGVRWRNRYENQLAGILGGRTLEKRRQNPCVLPDRLQTLLTQIESVQQSGGMLTEQYQGFNRGELELLEQYSFIELDEDREFLNITHDPQTSVAIETGTVWFLSRLNEIHVTRVEGTAFLNQWANRGS